MSLSDHARAHFWTLRRNRILAVLIPITLVILAVLAGLRASPGLARTPDLDTGVYLFMGSRILQGGVPYLDVWDNHQPLIYYVNALGLALGGPGGWGIWLLNIASISTAVLMLHAFLRRYFGAFPAFFAAAALLGNLVFVFGYGNVPEGYGLALQAGLLLLAVSALSMPGSRGPLFAIGVVAGLAVSLKLTLVGVPAAVMLALLAAWAGSRNTRWLLNLGWMALGFGLVWVAWMVAFGSQQALASFWDQAFRYNLWYSGITNPQRLQTAAGVLASLWAQSGFFVVGLLTWLVVLPYLFANDARFRRAVTHPRWGWVFLAAGVLILANSLLDDQTGGLVPLAALSRYRWGMLAVGLVSGVVSALFFSGWAAAWSNRRLPHSAPGDTSSLRLPLGIALVDLPLELLLSSFSGQKAAHYFMPMLPSLTILVAFLVWSAAQSLAVSKQRAGSQIWLAVLALPVLFWPWVNTLAAVSPRQEEHVRQVVDYIREHSSPDEAVLQWGTDTRIYYLSSREAASRYGSQQALFSARYTSPEKIEVFLSDVRSRPPVLIVDTRPANMPLVTAGPPDCGQFESDAFLAEAVRRDRDLRFPLATEDPLPYVPAEMKRVYQWVCENYTLAWPADPEPDGWRIYRLSQNPERQ